MEMFTLHHIHKCEGIGHITKLIREAKRCESNLMTIDSPVLLVIANFCKVFFRTYNKKENKNKKYIVLCEP